MRNLAKTILVAFVAVFANTFAVAEEVQPAKECCEPFKLDLTTDAALYSFENNDVVVVTEKFSYDFNKELTFNVAVPFYNDGSDTGVGDIDFSASYNLYNGKCDFLSTDVGLQGLFGVKVPLDGDYSSGEAVYYVGGVLDFTWDKWNLSQSFNYDFVGDYTYSPIFNGFISEDVYGGVTTLSYIVNEGMAFCVNATQSYCDDFDALLVGPSVKCTWKNITGHVGVDFPVEYNVGDENLDAVVTGGISFQF
jgi:hypothetical protein